MKKRVLSHEQQLKMRLQRSDAAETRKLQQERRSCAGCGLEGVSPCQSIGVSCPEWCKGISYHIFGIAGLQLCYQCANEKFTTKTAKHKKRIA